MSTNRDPQAYLQQFHFAAQDHTQWNHAFDAQVRAIKSKKTCSPPAR